MKLIKPITLLLVLLMSIGLVAAASTFEQPVTSGTITGSYYFNVTSTIAATVQNCSITGSSSASGDSLATTWLYNLTATSANATVDTTALEDAADWTFSGTCYNSTGGSETLTAITSVTVDNTNPTAPTLTSPTDDSKDDDGSITFAVAVTGSQTTACTLDFSNGQFSPGSSSYSMTHTGDTCTHTLTSVPAHRYIWFVTASDGTDTVNSADWVVESTQGAFGRRRTPVESSTPDSSKKVNPLIVVAIILGILYYANKKK